MRKVTEEFISPIDLSMKYGISSSKIKHWVKTAGKKVPRFKRHTRWETTETTYQGITLFKNTFINFFYIFYIIFVVFTRKT